MPLDVTLLQQPFDISFSGNPLPFSFAISPYRDGERSQDIRLQVRVLVEAGGTFQEVKSQTFYPDYSGMITLDVSTYVDPYLQYYLPRPSLSVPVAATGQAGRYKLSYTLLRGSSIAVAAQDSPSLTAIKGGMSYDEWHPSAFFTDYLFAVKNFLSFSVPGEKWALEELRYLYWLAPAAGTFRIRYTTVSDSGAEASFILSQTIEASQYSTWCIPAGYLQVPVLQSGGPQFLQRYTVAVLDSTNAVVAIRSYTTDYRNVYDAYQLLYRNSAGGLETIRLRGQADFEADYDRQQAQRTVPPAYFGRGTIAAALTDTATEAPKYKADTGFLSRSAADKLRDLFLSPEKWEWDGRKLLPISLLTKNTKFFSNRDSLISILIEWQRAYSNAYYTPAGTLNQLPACPSVVALVVKQVGKSKLQIMYALQPGYSEIEVQLVVGGTTTTYNYTGNSRSVLQDFTNPATSAAVGIQVKARTLCDSDSVPVSASAYTTVNLNVVPNSLPIVANDTYNVNSGSGPYTLGSILANDVDPDGDPIEAVPRIAATARGGLYNLAVDGTFQYGPPQVSPAFTGEDYFDVEVREVGSTTTVTGRVFIIVGGSGGVVYVKLSVRNTKTQTSGNTSFTTGEIWLSFFSNAAGTQPLNVTSTNLSLNVRDHYRKSRRRDGSTLSESNTDRSYTGTGTQMKIADSLLNVTQIGEVEDHTWSILPGNGYTAI